MKIYCDMCNKYIKSKNYKISYVFFKKLAFSIVYSTCGHEFEKYLKKNNSRVSQPITIKSEEILSQKIRLKNIGETRNYLIKEINQNELKSKKHEKVDRGLNYIDHLLIPISTVSGCLSISALYL